MEALIPPNAPSPSFFFLVSGAGAIVPEYAVFHPSVRYDEREKGPTLLHILDGFDFDFVVPFLCVWGSGSGG